MKSELIEAIKELAGAVDALNVTLVGIAGNDLFVCTCGDCGKEFKDGMDFGVGGQFCNECMQKYFEKQKRTTVDPGKTSSEKRGV